MCIKDITVQEAGRFLVEDILLSERALPDKELEAMLEGRGYCPITESNYIGVYHCNILICVTKWEYFTDIAANIHPYLSSLLHGKAVTMDVWVVLRKWFMENTSFSKLVVLAPGPCPNVHKAASSNGFVLEGLLTNTMQWRGKIEDLHIYGLDLNRLRGL